MAITHLDCVQIATPTPDAVGRSFVALLGRRAETSEDGIRIGFANSALEIVEGTRPGLHALIFAGEANAAFPIRGVASACRAGAGPARPTPLDADAPGAAIALDHVVIRSRDLDACLLAYQNLGLRLALDRTFPERGVRLVFFRFGGVTLELSGRHPPDPVPADSGAGDGLWGLAWRVPSIEAARDRVTGAGFDITEFRAGHKAGTRVFTVVDPPCAVPTLIIEDPSRNDAVRRSGEK